MRRLLLSAVAIVVLTTMGLSGTSRAAHADEFWCWGDPLLTIDGVPVTVAVGGTADRATVVNAVHEVTYVISVSSDTDVRVVKSGGLLSEVVKVERRADDYDNHGHRTPVKVTTTFDASKKLDVRLEVSFAGQVLTDWGETKGDGPAIEFSLHHN